MNWLLTTAIIAAWLALGGTVAWVFFGLADQRVPANTAPPSADNAADPIGRHAWLLYAAGVGMALLASVMAPMGFAP